MNEEDRAKMMAGVSLANDRSWSHVPATMQPTPEPPISASTLSESDAGREA